jgi:hypothetical protein
VHAEALVNVELADQIAERAHEGQVDKVGHPYIGHPRSVAGRLTDPDAQVVALLHDVIEDTTVTAEDLRAAGITDRQLEAIETLTHADDVDNETYWRAVRVVPLARMVKIADLADNCDPIRVARLDPATAEHLRGKYRRALGVLLWDDSPAGPQPAGQFAEFSAILEPSLPTLGRDVLEPPTGSADELG